MFSKSLITKVFNKSNYFNQCSLSKTVKYYFAFPTLPSDYANLKKLSGLMNAKQLDINEEIDYEGQVRLINTNNKQIGVMSFDEALYKIILQFLIKPQNDKELKEQKNDNLLGIEIYFIIFKDI